MGLVMAGEALKRAIRNDFDNTWKPRYETSIERLQGAVRFGVPSSNLTELYGYGEPPKVVERVPWGEAPTAKPYRYRSFEVVNYRFMNNVAWFRRDDRLSNLGNIKRDAQRAGARFGELTERIFYETIQGAATILPFAPKTPRGGAMFSATEPDGSDRFGISGGNIVSGQTFTTGAGLRSAIWRCLERYDGFLDPEGQPSMPTTSAVTVIVPSTMRETTAEAFKQSRSAFATSADAGNIAVTNSLTDAGVTINLISTPRLTASTAIYVFIQDFDLAPFFEQVAMDVEDYFYDANNSPMHGKAGVEESVFECWKGYGLNEPLAAIKATT